ncbi:sushi domain-containing protein 2-like [Antedon mediterranea]|uniref:sushi domain-containing protein 2-like n=1 Tax=Antedon mediterranea TaxID=105859 RepID=UPI003AF950A7
MTRNDGSFSFVPSAMANVTTDNAFGIIRVHGSSSDPILYSKIHALGYLLEDSYQDRSFNWSQNACVNWYEADQTTPDYIANLPSCPCTLGQALADGSRFQPDTGCSLFQGSVCTYHKGAQHCVRSIFPTTDNSGVQCCYTEEGDLVYAGDSFNGSTADRSHPWGVTPYGTKGKVPTMSHWVDDVISFYYCCIWTDNSDDCWNYMERRPTADCRNYVPPTHATIYGDPHVYTFDGLGYTANLKGEFLLLQSIDSDALQIQGRMEQISNYNGKIQLATGLTAIAMKDLSTDTVQVELDPISMLIISHGSDKVDVKNQKLINFKGVTAVFDADFTGGNITKVSFIFDSGIAVQVNAIPQLMSLSITIPPTLTGKISGFFGDANNVTSNDPFGEDELLTDEQNLFAYANANMEIDSDDSLFKYELGKSHSDYHNASFKPLFEDPPGTNIPSNTLNLMPETCEGISSCEYDVLTTGLLDVGEATRQAVDQYFLNRNGSLAVIACPYIRTPSNGKKGFVGGQNNHLVGATITFYCNDGYILSGSTTRNCKSNGEWTGTTDEPICYYARDCGSLEPPENGYITVDRSDDEIVAEFTCNDGYNLGGSSVRTCSGDVWTGETTGCYDGLTPDQQLALILGLVIPIVIIVAVVIAFIMYRKRKREKEYRGTSAGAPMENIGKTEEYTDEPKTHVPSAANI